GGNIYWSPATGAHEVHGQILGAYAWAGWENGVLGFPITGEIRTPNGRGAYNAFEGGSVYWSPGTGAHVVRGAIRDAWAGQGWEGGRLGFPTSSEFDIPGGRRVNFESGYIEWSPATGARVNQPISGPAAPPSGPVIPGTIAIPGEVNLDGLVLRAESVRRVAPPSGFSIGYTAGQVPVEVTLSIRNTTNGLWDPFDLVSLTSNGAEAEQVFSSDPDYGGGFGDTSLAPGQTRTARYLFSVPPASLGDLLVEAIIYDVQDDRHVAQFSGRI
ncbi:LGFP repeat-containing protein, partial [Kineococcus glutinatus]|uniref:LGFP repeat-containing protein n=1 Tax=Kineococcus glutinatus TaxID=1070872 RepID=UPI003CD06C23